MYRLRAKRTTGTEPPADMLFGEIAYSDGDQQLYIGRPTGPPAVFLSDLSPITDEIGSLATITLDQQVELAALTTTTSGQALDIAALATSDSNQDTSIAALTTDLATLDSSQATQDTAIGALITAVAIQGTAIDALDASSFSGAYADLTGKPALFSGVYGDLTGIPSTFAPAAHSQAWSTITSTPTTLAGYGIGDAAAAAPVQSVAGRAGAVVLAKADVGLGNVDNTTDAAKPVSTATQTDLNSITSKLGFNYIGATEPVSPANGFRWLEVVSNSVKGQWEWNSTIISWISIEEFRQSLSAAFGNLTTVVNYSTNLNQDGSTSRYYITKIRSIYRRTTGTVDASNFYTMTISASNMDGSNGVTTYGSFLINIGATTEYLETIINALLLAAYSGGPVAGICIRSALTGTPGAVRYSYVTYYRLVRT